MEKAFQKLGFIEITYNHLGLDLFPHNVQLGTLFSGHSIIQLGHCLTSPSVCTSIVPNHNHWQDDESIFNHLACYIDFNFLT